MTAKDLKYIADIEIMKEGHLSKGIRLEVANLAKTGHPFTMVVSTDDYINISAALRRSGYKGMSSHKAEQANRRVMKFNQPSK